MLNHILAKVLIQELDQEKERRWKAEQAEKKLIEHVRELQKHAKEEKNIQSMAVYTTDRYVHYERSAVVQEVVLFF